MTSCTFTRMTGAQRGAIAVFQFHGDVERALVGLTGRDDWPVGRMRLANLAGLDEGLVGRIDEQVAQVMPHGGPRIAQRLAERLIIDLGIEPAAPEQVSPRALYPEAKDEIEARLLLALSRAASPLAIDPLLAQPAIWRRAHEQNEPVTEADRDRSVRLRRMLTPPTVVLAGPANVGKSTLSNALLGRSMSIALDEPGTTRDYTAARLELAGLVVNWHDTPGLRSADDPTETKAIELARRLMVEADLLLAITDAEHDWPALPREPALRLASKADKRRRIDADLHVSASTGAGLSDLVHAVRDRLVPPEDRQAAFEHRWLFDAALDALGTKAATSPARGGA